MENSQLIGTHIQSARGTTKSAARVTIRNVHVLNNYLIPFFKSLGFVSKKGKDLLDFEMMCRILYFGAHKDDVIKSLLLKLSYSMNSFRLSNAKEPVSALTEHEMALLNNATAYFEHLTDGRVVDVKTNRVVDQNCIILISYPNGDIDKLLTLEEAAVVLKVSRSTLGKHLNNNVDGTLIKGCHVKRVRIFYPAILKKKKELGITKTILLTR